MGADFFQVRTRLRAVKSSLRKTPEANAGTLAHAETVGFVSDLMREMAQQHPKGEAAGMQVVARCMADALIALTGLPRVEGSFAAVPLGANPKPIRDFRLWPTDRWPVQVDPRVFKEQSALKMLGYTTGRTNGWAKAVRQEFMCYFIEAHLPRQVIETFGDEYGPPNSDVRLLKTASLLAAHVRNFTRNDAERYELAITDWREDLDFLWERYGAARVHLHSRWPRL